MSVAPDHSMNGGFADTEPTETIHLTPSDIPAVSADADVYAFLAKPVKIHSTTWVSGAEPTDFQPWGLFFNNAAVKRKLSNYLLVSGTLRLNIVTNGSPFQYGLCSYGYLPLRNDQYRLQANGLTGYTIQNFPFRFYVDASKNQSVEIDLPWVWGTPNVIPLNDYTQGGEYLSLVESALRSASAGPLDAKVSITVYASLVNTKLQFRTGGIVVSDYTGVLSKPLSVMAKKVGAFGKVPIIGEYATPASMVAKGAADLATLFGYSAPNNVEQPMNTVTKTTSALASTINVDGGDVLALDPRATTSIDPRLVGIDPKDEMVIKEIATRFSLVATKTWTLDQGIDAEIFSISNSPFYTDQTLPCSFSHVGFSTLPFRYFRGTLRYKFKIPCSKVHTGRIQFLFEPWVDISGADVTNIVQNVIYDLSSDSEVILEVPYTGKFLATQYDFYASSIASLVSNTVLGTIKAKVVTPLKAAGVAADVTILVNIAAGDDWEVFVPQLSTLNSGTFKLSYFDAGAITAPPALTAITGYAVSATITEPSTTELKVEEPNSTPAMDPYPLLIASENVISFRNLIKRFAESSVITLPSKASTAGVVGQLVREIPGNPYITRSNAGGNPLYLNKWQWNIMNYLAPAYYSYRGGTRHKFIDLSPAASTLMFVSRYEVGNPENFGFAYSTNATDAFRALGDGATISTTSSTQRKAVEVTNPWRGGGYSRLLNDKPSQFDSGNRMILLGYAGNTTVAPEVLHLVAGADDFTFFLYIGSPVFFRIAV